MSDASSSDHGDLDETIVYYREELGRSPRGGRRIDSLNDLGRSLVSRFDKHGALEDLEEAITLHREELELCSNYDDSLRAGCINNLADCLSKRFNQQGVLGDLEEAISLHRQGLELSSEGESSHSYSLNNLADCLSKRFIQKGSLDDLEEAIGFHRRALKHCPEGHALRSFSLNNLADCLSKRFNQRGLLSDLEEAITLHRQALELCSPGDFLRPLSLNNLGDCLSKRFDHQGVLGDLEEAISLDRQGLEICTRNHPHRPFLLNNLADCLSKRFDQLDMLRDLEEAITLHRQSKEICSDGHFILLLSMNNLANCLTKRFKKQGTLDDLEEAIALHRQSLELRPEGHTRRPFSIKNLADCLYQRFNRLGIEGDLEEAIILLHQVLKLCPQGHSLHLKILAQLALCLQTQFRTLNSTKALEEAFDLYSQIPKLLHSISFHSIHAIKEWIAAAEEFQHHTAITAYETSLDALVYHLATLPSLPNHLSVFKHLTSTFAVDAFSACICENHFIKAVELLEQGRGVFWNQLVKLYSPLAEVIASGDEGRKLAEDYASLTAHLRHILNTPSLSQHDLAWHLSIQVEEIVTSIRELPGQSRFLLPLPYQNLQQAASEGPIVIVNASQYGCDALIILSDQDPIHLSLNEITKKDIGDMASTIHSATLFSKPKEIIKCLTQVLRELWEYIVEPIVTILHRFYPYGSRIWWCPTAEFSLLPLHAAGPYQGDQKNFPDYYISSYTPTLNALIRARQQSISDNTQPTDKQLFIAVGQGQGINQKELPSVQEELNIIEMHVSQPPLSPQAQQQSCWSSICLPKLQLPGVKQKTNSGIVFTRIEGQTATVDRVAKELCKNEFVHLACHGIPNQKKPFESSFALSDGHLTIENIIHNNMQHAKFAYLSACHTTTGDKESPDEAIHLAAAMHFVGFRSVIGTMWAVNDAFANEVASEFYQNLIDESGHLDYTSAAHALHKSIKNLKITHEMPLDQQILFIHIGV